MPGLSQLSGDQLFFLNFAQVNTLQLEMNWKTQNDHLNFRFGAGPHGPRP